MAKQQASSWPGKPADDALGSQRHRATKDGTVPVNKTLRLYTSISLPANPLRGTVWISKPVDQYSVDRVGLKIERQYDTPVPILYNVFDIHPNVFNRLLSIDCDEFLTSTVEFDEWLCVFLVDANPVLGRFFLIVFSVVEIKATDITRPGFRGRIKFDVIIRTAVQADMPASHHSRSKSACNTTFHLDLRSSRVAQSMRCLISCTMGNGEVHTRHWGWYRKMRGWYFPSLIEAWMMNAKNSRALIKPWERFEPPTRCLQGICSGRLSYHGTPWMSVLDILNSRDFRWGSDSVVPSHLFYSFNTRGRNSFNGGVATGRDAFGRYHPRPCYLPSRESSGCWLSKLRIQESGYRTGGRQDHERHLSRVWCDDPDGKPEITASTGW